MSKYSRNFILTLNEATLEYYTDVVNYLKSLKGLAYFLVTEHIGQGNKHYHCYVQYKNAKRLAVSKLHGAHFEKCYGSAQSNIAYCKAEDEKHKALGITAILIEEEGEPLLKGGNYTVGYLEELDDKRELPAIFYNIYNNIQNKKKSDEAFYDMLTNIENDSLRPVQVVYFIGKPGSGKTYNAYKYALSLFNKEDITKVTIQNNFFEFVGSNQDKCLVVEEFRPSQLHPSSLLQFTDKYGYSCPIKGGYKYVKPEMIIICSIIHPTKLYREEKCELNEQFTRRITHLYEVHSNHSYTEIFLDTVCIGGLPVGRRTSFNQLEEYEVTDDWDGSHIVIN